VVERPTREGDICHVGWLFVEEQFRGQGYGNMLMERLYKDLQEQGCQYVGVNSSSSAYEFYRKQGFEPNYAMIGGRDQLIRFLGDARWKKNIHRLMGYLKK
jgi:ribosomal protein S18 acetylase RimI-like enzyme